MEEKRGGKGKYNLRIIEKKEGEQTLMKRD